MLTGLDQLFGGHLSNLRKRLRNSRVALLTHSAAVDRKGRTALAVLDELGAEPVLVLAPEHGLDGYAQAQEAVVLPEATARVEVGSREEPNAADSAAHDADDVARADDDVAAPPAIDDARFNDDGHPGEDDEPFDDDEFDDEEHDDDPPFDDEDEPPTAGDDEPSTASEDEPSAASDDAPASDDEDDAAPTTAVAAPKPLFSDDVPFGPRHVSLYGTTRESLTPTADQLAGIDVLVIDLVDVGSRYYTYVWTALLAARAAAALGIHVVVLDRPNPIGGDAGRIEGALQQPDYLSFVGLEPLPIRHGLTIGELLARAFELDGKPLGPNGALTVVTTQGWERARGAEAWGRPFVMPSPNMPTLETALVYPGGCLLEGTNLSEGRGTTAPFQLVGAPFLDGEQLARDLVGRGLPGTLFRPVAFRPTFDKFAGQVCRGIMLHVTNAQLFRPVATYLALITLAKRQCGEQFQFSSDVYEFEHEKPAFDLLTGSSAARQALLAGASVEEVIDLVAPAPSQWAEELAAAEARLERARA